MYILQRLRPFESATSAANLEMAPVFNYEHLKPLHKKYGILPGIGKMHHFAGDYHIGLSLGWGGLLKKVRHYAAQYPDKAEFYAAEEDVLLGVQSWISRTVERIARNDPPGAGCILRENLQEMLEANEWLIENPPRNFREACQWIAWNNMAERTYCRAGAGGQLDELLRPYYEQDFAAGKIDEEKATYILACLLLNDPHYYQIAGPDAQGRDQTSALSFMILEAAHRMNTTCNLTIRVHDGLDESLLRRAIEILLEDRKGLPRFSGDTALVTGFMKNGYPASLARQRIAVGCNWMSLPGLEYTMNDLIKINLAKVFEVAYQEYSETPGEKNVAALYELYQAHLAKAVQCVAEGIDFHLANQYRNAPELTLNLISHGPIEKGPGRFPLAAWNTIISPWTPAAWPRRRIPSPRWSSGWKRKTSGIGIQCIRPCKAILQARRASAIRLALWHGPRYGYGGSLGDAWADRLSQGFTKAIASRRTPKGVLMIPGLFSWANTVMFGEMVGATPNGRHARAPISHGANPNPGFRQDGAVTALSAAVARVQPGYGNTAPLQLEFDPQLKPGKEAVDVIENLIRTHFALGGTLININILDGEKLMAANKNPALYPDLVVRVTGFTAYFATLSPEFRQLVVDRFLYGV